jgi:hypothetical protein
MITGYGAIATTSIMLAILAAGCTAWVAHLIPWKPLESIRRMAGNPMLFMAVVFSLILILTGYLFRSFLFKVLLPLAIYDVLAMAAAFFGIYKSRMRAAMRNLSPATRSILLIIISLLTAAALILTLMILIRILLK